MVYLLVNKDAEWIRNNGEKGLHRDGKRLTMDIRQLVCAIRSYWQSELVSVGIKVLETLDTLHKSNSNGSAFHQSTSLLHIFEVSKFLLDCQYLNLTSPCEKKLQNFLGISTTYFDLVFPLDWRKSVSEDLISLRKTDLSVKLLVDFILQSFDIKGNLTYWTVGRVVMICLSCRKPLGIDQMVEKGLQWNPAWKSFFKNYVCGGLKDAYVAPGLQKVLEDTFKANWSSPDYISPHSFIYLLDSLLFFASFSSRIMFSTRSSLVGWLAQFHSTATPSTNLKVSKQIISDNAIHFIIGTVKEILYKKSDFVSWIKKSKLDPTYYHPLLALKLVMMLSLICLQVPDQSQVLAHLLSGSLGGNEIVDLLPMKFACNLLKRMKGSCLNLNPDVVAEAFMSIEDPLLIVSSGNASPRIHAPCATFVDLRKSKEEIMTVLFPRKTVQNSSNNDSCGTNHEETSSNKAPDASPNVNPVGGEDRTLVSRAFSELKTLSSAFDSSRQKMVHGAMERLHSFKPKLDDFLNRSFASQELKIRKMVVSGSSSTTEVKETETETETCDDSVVEGKGNSKGIKCKQSKGKRRMA